MVTGRAAAFLFSALVLLIFLPLFQKGSFIDAMLYKTVALNLAEGKYSFWHMHYTATSMTFFCEQPPLYMYLLGKCYAWFGFDYRVDRLFSAIQFLLFLYVLRRICGILFSSRGRAFFLLAIFLLLTVQSLCWSIAQQVIEGQVLLFTAIFLFLYLEYLRSGYRVYLLGLLFTGILLFLTKGFQSCFIVLLPLLHAGFRRDQRAIVDAIALSASLIILLFIGYQLPSAREWYQCYYEARLLRTMQNVGATTSTHFGILGQALLEMSPALLILCGLWLKTRKNIRPVFRSPHRKGSPFRALFPALAISALAGILPYALSLVQRGFYLVPAYLPLMLALMLGFQRQWLYGMAVLDVFFRKRLPALVINLLLGGTLLFSIYHINEFKREEGLERDMNTISQYLRSRDTLRINGNMWNHFNIHSLLYQQKRVSLSPEAGKANFLLTYKNELPENNNSKVVKVDLATTQVDLYYILRK